MLAFLTTVPLAAPDYIVITGYFAIVIFIGIYFNKRQTASQDYFAGGHRVPWWLAGISHYMSSFSAFAFIAYSQIAYIYGTVAMTLFWTTAPACVIGGLFFARQWRRARVVSPVEFLERRFNAPIRQLFAWAGIPAKLFDDALKIFATALILSTAVGIGLKTAVVVCAIVTVTYTLLGGLWALVVTDYVQFLMKIAAMALLLPLAVWRVMTSPQPLHPTPAGFFHLTNGPYGWLYIVSFTMLTTISYNGTWALAQKYYSVPDERSAQKVAYLSAALNLVGTPLMLVPAVLSRKMLPNLFETHRTADTYVLLVIQILPAGMIGIIVAAMFSATMAAVSSDLNASASVLTRDFFVRVLRPNASEQTQVRAGRLFTLGLGTFIVSLSLWIAVSHQEALFHAMVTVFGLFLAPTLLPILAGLTIRRLTWKGALAGFLSGLITGIIMLAIKTWYLPVVPGISPEWASYTFEGISIFVNIAATVIGLWLGSVIPSRDLQGEQRAADFFRAMEKPIAASEAVTQRDHSESLALGIATISVGLLLALAGAVAGKPQARWIDLAFGILLASIGGKAVHTARQPKGTRASVRV